MDGDPDNTSSPNSNGISMEESNMDEQTTVNSIPQSEDEDSTKPKETSCKSQRKGLAVIDSDSDEDMVNAEHVDESDSSEQFTKLHRKILDDSDAEGETPLMVKDTSFVNEGNSNSLDTGSTVTDSNDAQFKKRHAVIDSDSEEEHSHQTEDAVSNVQTANHSMDFNDDYRFMSSRITALCDEDSDDSDSQAKNMDDTEFNEATPTATKARRPPKESKKQNAQPKEKKMTAKVAIQQMQEIKSASQKRVREKQVSLPYHKPKCHSIKEFLQNRPRLSLALRKDSAKTPPAAALKMTTAELEVISKKLEEREKVVQQFYMSESESEEENNLKDDNQSMANTSDSETKSKHVDEEKQIHSDGDSNTDVLTNEGSVAEETERSASPNLILDNMDSECSESKTQDILENTNVELASNENVNVLQSNNDNLPSSIENENLLQETRNESETTVTNLSLLPPNDTDIALSESPNVCDKGEAENTANETPLQEPYEDANNENTNTAEVLDPAKSTTCTSDTSRDATEMESQDNYGELDFSLDDVDPVPVQNTNSNVEEQHIEGLLKKYSGSPSTDNNQPTRLSTLQLLKQKVGDFTPCLSGSPDEDIDLEQDTTKPNEVSLLIKRFMKHSIPIKKRKQKVELDVINYSQGEIHHETVAMSLDPEEDTAQIIQKPGEKLRKLQHQLQTQLAQQRSELWQQKLQSGNKLEATDKDTEKKSTCGTDVEDEILDDEEEAELTDQDITDEEDVSDNTKADNGGATSEFIDEEAEEDDADDEAEDSDSEENKDGNEIDSSKAENSKINTEPESLPTKRVLKRIVKGFTEDSDDEEDTATTIKPSHLVPTTCEDESDDETIPPNQPRVDLTPLKSSQQQTVPSLLTPLMHLAGLQHLDSGSKFLEESPVSHTPFKENPQGTQRKLFPSTNEELDSTSNACEIAEAPSTSFSATQIETVQIPNTQDLFNLCSGDFPDTCVPKENETPAEEPTGEIKTLSDDKLISEILDEDEMEQFKKKFESPVAAQSNPIFFESESESEDDVPTNIASLLESEDSDNESIVIRNRRSRKKFSFLDDDCTSCDEAKRTGDYSSDERDDSASGGDVEYDSEENEIDFDQNEAPKMKHTDYFEKEAELSESEWDSEDEDEKGLDVLEAEQGDADVFDENKMKNDLEKIHMRRVLDQDNHEIKMLQELLLEDGELHGTGRKRQYRWNNIDYGNDMNDSRNPVEIFFEDEQSEEQWRIARHKREMFLKKQFEKLQNVQTDDTTSDKMSTIIRLGQAALRKSLSTTTTVPEKPKVVQHADRLPAYVSRGSFLARTEEFLNKLATFSRASAESVMKSSKAPKGYVFQTKNEEDNKGVKRKGPDTTPAKIKKLRLNKFATSPATLNKKK